MGSPGQSAEERRLLGGVPARVARADAVGDLDARRERRLAQQVVGVLGQALDRRRARRCRASRPAGARARRTARARASRWRRRPCRCRRRPPRAGPTAADLRDVRARSPPASIDPPRLPVTGDRAVHDARRHQALGPAPAPRRRARARRGWGRPRPSCSPGSAGPRRDRCASGRPSRTAGADERTASAAVTARGGSGRPRRSGGCARGSSRSSRPTMLQPASSSAG